ncbi:MAG: alpha-amylase [Blastocatellia bacterium]|nr:alpha-amylase [Blastocatellia bacterium]
MVVINNPLLFQINTRVWLTQLSNNRRRHATLDDIPKAELDRLAELGFDWIYLLSVWQTGQAGRQVSRNNPEWRKEFEETLPDLREEDIAGSGFAITGYTVPQALGGDAALSRFREQLHKRGMRLMLDFVPNHTGLDHPWVEDYPEFYISGTEQELAAAPMNYIQIRRRRGDLLLAYGRDPFFPGWPDTLQLNYGNPATQEAMIGVLSKIATQCDGVRCDMAMLVLPEVFERTWGIQSQPFWPKAIQRVRELHPGFCFMAEAYWDKEWTLQQQGFDYTYDKRLYDRLLEGKARAVREHFLAGVDYQKKLVRFLENHDERRAAAAFFPGEYEAAALITYLSMGLRFFHQGQFEGRKKRISPHLVRGPIEPIDHDLERFYTHLLALLRQPAIRNGHWQLLDCVPAWEGNWTWDCFLAFAWQNDLGDRLLVTVNYAPNQSQCYVRLPFSDLENRQWRFEDLLSKEEGFDREGNDLSKGGLYIDAPPWKASVYSMKVGALARRGAV